MIPWLQIDEADVPDGGKLRLMRRGAEFSIMLGAVELMNSRLGGSEQALATFACDLIADRAAPRLLIGGLGMGFTLRAALIRVAEDASVDVAELVPAVVGWAKGPLAKFSGASLVDPRVRILVKDVGDLIAAASGAYDAIMLDVDNGPDGLTRNANDRLYAAAGLAAARRALRPGGVLAVWSSARDDHFARRLRQSHFQVEEKYVHARRARGAKHVIWIAVRP